MTVQDIAINECVHYRGFRYGGFGNNIYEDFILGLANNVDITQLRSIFTKRVLAYKGKDFSSALNIKLSRKYTPWIYPWTLRTLRKGVLPNYSPTENPDIICHYSPEGILTSHINREFFWLERAYKAISSSGYRPELYGYINLACLRNKTEKRYLVLDGNHRLSAAHALGISKVKANVIYPLLWDKRISKFWPGVISKNFSHEDAITIFERYFVDSNLTLPESDVLNLIEDEPLFT